MHAQVLLDFIRGELVSNDRLWSFRKHFAVQYACNVLISHALSVNAANPSKFILSRVSVVHRCRSILAQVGMLPTKWL